MTEIQIFAFLVLPAFIAIMGGGIAYYVGRRDEDKSPMGRPGE